MLEGDVKKMFSSETFLVWYFQTIPLSLYLVFLCCVSCSLPFRFFRTYFSYVLRTLRYLFQEVYSTTHSNLLLLGWNYWYFTGTSTSQNWDTHLIQIRIMVRKYQLVVLILFWVSSIFTAIALLFTAINYSRLTSLIV